MKASVVVVSLSLTLAIVLVTLLLIVTQAGAIAPSRIGAGTHSLQVHLWKMKNAPAMMKAKPTA